jgi:hypothetical protein
VRQNRSPSLQRKTKRDGDGECGGGFDCSYIRNQLSSLRSTERMQISTLPNIHGSVGLKTTFFWYLYTGNSNRWLILFRPS